MGRESRQLLTKRNKTKPKKNKSISTTFHDFTQQVIGNHWLHNKFFDVKGNIKRIGFGGCDKYTKNVRKF